jgi:twinkle protein
MARKLGLGRCFIVKSDDTIENAPKDANDALRRSDGVQLIENMLTNAKLLSHERLQSFKDLRGDIIKSLFGNAVVDGVKSPSLPALSNILKGFRRGELVIFSGPTGIVN